MNKKESKREKKESGSLFIPAGLFIGLGLGFLYNQIVPGVLLGLGSGFLIFALVNLLRKRK